MSRTFDAVKLSGLGSRFAAFVAERHPFALTHALTAFESSGLAALKARDAGKIDAARPALRRALAKLLYDNVTAPDGVADPTPGTTNSLASGKRCLCNYTPVIAETAGGRRLAIGASGGRRIMPSVMQLASFAMDFGMDLDAAIHQPRIDASEGAVVIGDARLPAEVRKALAARFDYEETQLQALPMKFACPSVVMRDGDTNSGATEIFQPWAEAVAES